MINDKLIDFAKNDLQIPDEIIETFDPENPDAIIDAIRSNLILKNEKIADKQAKERENQYKRGLVEATNKFQNALREKATPLVEIPNDIQGIDIIGYTLDKLQETLSTTGADAKVAKEWREKHDRALLEMENKIAAAKKPLEEEINNLKAQQRQREVIEIASKELPKIEDKFVFDPTTKGNLLDIVFKSVQKADFREEGDKRYLLDEYGNLKLDKMGNTITFEGLLEMEMSKYFPKKVSNGTSTTGAGGQQSEPKDGKTTNKFKEPQTQAEYVAFMSDRANDATARQEYRKLYGAKYQ